MFEKEITIKNKTGLHARPAARFVNQSKKYESEITIVCNEKGVNAKSIMGVMTVGAVQGKKVFLRAEGKDEKKAIEELAIFIEEELPKMDRNEE